MAYQKGMNFKTKKYEYQYALLNVLKGRISSEDIS
jgi:hypothetical protein